MPICTIENTTGDSIWVSELYTTIGAGEALEVYRSAGQLTAMKELHNYIASGVLTLSITYTADEVASGFNPYPGLGGGGGGYVAQNLLFVGKHGDDGNTGCCPAEALKTFTAAIAKAQTQSPGPNNRIGIWCEDAGAYTENLIVPSWVGILAFAALIEGNHQVSENSLLQSFRLVYNGTGPCVKKVAGPGSATVKCPRMVLSNSADGVICTSGAINYEGESMEITNGYGIGSASTAVIDACINEIYIAGTGIGIGLTANGEIDYKGNRISGVAGATALHVGDNGKVHASVGHIECGTAYNVSAPGAELDLVTNELVGARAGVGTANVTIAGFSGERVGLVASNELTNSGTAVRLGAGIFNADGYPTGATFTLRCAVEVDSGITYNIRVYDVTAGAYLSGTISGTNGSLEAKSLALTLGSGERVYELHAWLTSGGGGVDYVRVPSAFIDIRP